MSWEGVDDTSYVSPGVPKRHVQWYLLEDVDSRAKWFTVSLLVVSIAMLIAGSVMLGIGISKNNNSPNPVNSQVAGYTMFVTVQTRSLPYSSVVQDYTGSVQNLTDQMRQTITQSASASVHFDSQPDIPIAILGISNAGQWADVMYALSYSDSNKPTLSDVQQKVANSTSFVLVSATDKTSTTLNQMICSVVSDSTLTTTTSARTSNPITAPGQTTVTSNPNSPATTVTVPVVTASTSSVRPITTGTGSPVPPVSVATTVTPPVTEPVRTTTTPFVKTPYSKDVIILLDDSTAMINSKNFNTVKSWLVNTLLPLWLIDREDVQVAFATYADKEFNTLLAFDEVDEKEVTDVISAQVYSGKYNSSITNGIRAAGDIHGLRPVNQTVIFISASEDLTDIETATQYAYIINTLPKQLITVTLNSTTGGKQLGLLSTNQNNFFGVGDFNLTTDIAQQLTQYMFGTLTPTTARPITTAVPDNACKTDVTILLDNNNDVGGADEFQNQLRTISKLIKTWPISPELMEGEAVVFATTEGGQIVENPFGYQTASAFANEVMAYDAFYFANSPPSLSASLQYLSQNLDNRRKARSQTTLIVTYSSENTDVQSAVQFVDQIGGNLIVVAIGSADQTILKQLSGNVVYAKNMTTDIIDQVNSLICSPTTRAPVVTPTTGGATSVPVVTFTSTVVTSVSVDTSQTPASPSPTTPIPDPCPDCNPKTANILLLLEAFGDPLENQKKLAQNDLISGWTHFERTSVMGFDTLAKNLDPINFGDLQDEAEFAGIVQSLTAFKDQPTIVSAFNLAVTRAQPLKTFGKMHSVIFTSGATTAEVTASLAKSNTLKANGKVIIVGMKLAATNGLDTLADVLLNWDDLSNLSTISSQINQALNS
ncbi:unnamed protein product [Caenorhabditis sp. 36 PRJEB53466]|nr:unnamed protein product [Caenorhabditis sp. 36 PRJEB53466]